MKMGVVTPEMTEFQSKDVHRAHRAAACNDRGGGSWEVITKGEPSEAEVQHPAAKLKFRRQEAGTHHCGLMGSRAEEAQCGNGTHPNDAVKRKKTSRMAHC